MDFIKQNENNNNLINNQNNKSNHEINEFKNKIILLEKEKENLEKKVNELTNNNKFYENEIITLKNKLEEYEKENKTLKNKINNLNNRPNEQSNKNIDNNNINKIIELMEEIKIRDNELKIKDNEIKNKEKEIQEYKSILPNGFKKGDKLISVIFYSVDQKIHYSLICKNTDDFSTIETKLFKQFPEYQEDGYYFLANGTKINKYKTLEELKLKNSSIITMNIDEF